MDEIIVIDDFINLDYQEKIKSILMGQEEHDGYIFPWFYIDDVTEAYEKGNQGRAGLSHVYILLEDDNSSYVDSEFHSLFIPLLQHACNTLNINQASILQGRSFLQFPLNLKSKEEDTPHVDIDDMRHLVVLYYVCTADGDTIIYNEKKESDIYTEKQRVTPKQGRVVLFDGSHYHTAQQCTNKIRCIVNYNLG